MKSKSIQQSLLQQILALEQDEPTYFNHSNQVISNTNTNNNNKSIECNKQHNTINLNTNTNINTNSNNNNNMRNRSRNIRPMSCSITDLQDQILRMRIEMQKQLTQDKNTNKTNTQTTKNKHIMKTQNSNQNQPFSAPTHPNMNMNMNMNIMNMMNMNYSTIYTRRSSLDQSLYDKAIRQQSSRKQWITKQKKQQQNQQLKQCSYKPQINQTSKIIMSRVDKQQLYDKIKKKKQQSIKKIIEQQKKKQMQQCSFTPNLCKNSKKLVKSVQVQKFTIEVLENGNNCSNNISNNISNNLSINKSVNISNNNNKSNKTNNNTNTNTNNNSRQLPRHSISIFDHLYQQSKTRQLKNKKLQQNYTKQYNKKPQIDQISRIITQNTKFQQRQLHYQQKKIQKQIKIKQKQNKQLKQSYRPSINQISQSRKIETSIGQHLYLLSKNKQNNNNNNHHHNHSKNNTNNNNNHSKNNNNNNNNKQRIKQKQKQKQQNKIQINKKSNQVYQQRKILVFYQIFKLLDGDQDGSISINNIDIDTLPRQIVKIIYPLIQQLQVMQVQLHQHQFINSISNLFKTLTIHQKNILLGFIGGPLKQQNLQLFYPKINNKSKIITACNQRSQMSIYQYCSIRQVLKQKHLESQRIQQNKKQLENCTFQPKILIKNKR